MFSLCECCRGFISTAFVGEVKVCSKCFLKLKAVEMRLLGASEQKDIDDLEHLWKISEGNCVGR